ncbi:erythroblast NAD(P)(+)--arginine ADP-ribosyltransferase-like [Heptranchias perlo]|uniref:erythroblast NAD(P)(+)--arginine ADP-ribosyltransferase-like n=1 Tax=Heptranchias perlo TaxID=212740 RepID=UPI003559EC48
MRSLVLTLLIALCSNYQDILAVSVSEKNEKNVIDLDMAPNSAAYIFTQSPESDEIAINYIQKERENGTFDEVWKIAESNMKCKVPSGLKREHMLAVYAYTLEKPKGNVFYKMFNEAVRRYGATDSIYAKNFNFKSFHYLLSTALQKLRVDSGNKSHHTFRGIKKQAEAEEGATVRFGYFASSSLDEQVALSFFDKNINTNTMFEISTGYGTPIQECSSVPGETEILILPYEMFRVGMISPMEHGTKIELTGDGLQGTNVKVEKGEGGKLVVVRSAGAIISALGGFWILAALVSISV